VLAGAALITSSQMLERWEMPLWARLLLGTAPTPFMLLVPWTILEGIRRLDELQRTIMLQTIAIGFGGGWVIALLYNHLAKHADLGLPEIDTSTALTLLSLVGLAAYPFAASRYR